MTVWSASRRQGRRGTSLLRDPDHRERAARYLGKLGATEAAGPLTELLPTWDASSQITAVQVLGELGARQAAPEIRELAQRSENPLTRGWAASVLADLEAPYAFDAALPLLRDPSPWARGLAADTLGRLGDPRALEPLRETRPRLWPLVEWCSLWGRHRRAITAVKRSAGGKRTWAWAYATWFRRLHGLSWLFAWAAAYVAIALVVGFWWALVPVAAVHVGLFFMALLSMRSFPYD